MCVFFYLLVRIWDIVRTSWTRSKPIIIRFGHCFQKTKANDKAEQIDLKKYRGRGNALYCLNVTHIIIHKSINSQLFILLNWKVVPRRANNIWTMRNFVCFFFHFTSDLRCEFIRKNSVDLMKLHWFCFFVTEQFHWAENCNVRTALNKHAQFVIVDNIANRSLSIISIHAQAIAFSSFANHVREIVLT